MKRVCIECGNSTDFIEHGIELGNCNYSMDYTKDVDEDPNNDCDYDKNDTDYDYYDFEPEHDDNVHIRCRICDSQESVIKIEDEAWDLWDNQKPLTEQSQEVQNMIERPEEKSIRKHKKTKTDNFYLKAIEDNIK